MRNMDKMREYECVSKEKSNAPEQIEKKSCLKKPFPVRWQLVVYDIFILFAVDVLLLLFYQGNEKLSPSGIAAQAWDFPSFASLPQDSWAGSISRFGGMAAFSAIFGC